MMRVTLATTALLMVIGCGEPQPTSPGSISTTQPIEVKSSSDVSSEKVAESSVTVTIGSLEELHRAIAKHSGKVVVCDFWSTGCAPCLREFPFLVELSRKYPAAKLVCLSANLDYIGLATEPPESLKGPVLEFLSKQQAQFENYLLNEEDTQVYDKLKLSSIPAVYVYGVDGKVAKRFDDNGGEFTYEQHINPFIAELLNAAKSP